MRAGRLNKLIKIFKFDLVRNEYGEKEKQKVEVATVWASIDPISANEKYLQAKEQAEITHKIEIRFIEINTSMQIEFNDRVFDIKQVINPREKNEKLIIMAVEVEVRS